MPWRDADMSIDVDYDIKEPVDYLNMQPLDGEEGELIDDEACFIDVRAVTGIGMSRCCSVHHICAMRVCDAICGTHLI